MRRIGPFSIEGALLVVGLGVALLGGVTCTAQHYAERSARIVMLEAQVSAARHRTDSLIRLVDSVTRNVTTRMASNRKVGQRLSARLATNDSILSAYALMDGANDTTQTLIIALQRTTEVARLYRDSTDVLLGSVERLLASQSEERTAWLAERKQNTILVATQDSVISALRESGRACRILFIPCPSRVQSAGIGAGVVILLLL